MLCLHEVQEDPASELMTGCPPAFLAKIVEVLRRDGWELVSLDEAVRRIGIAPGDRPFAVLTFDDGYRDNLTCALPVLERLQAPFTVFVPTGAVTRELFAWWLALRSLILSQDEIVVTGMDERVSCADLPGKVAALKAVSRWVARDLRRQSALAATFRAYGILCGGAQPGLFSR